MTEARARREDRSRWAVPLMLGAAAALGAVAAVAPGVPLQSRIAFAASAAVPGALIIPAALASPPNKPRWLALGGFSWAAAVGTAGILGARDIDSCHGWCGNEKSLGWLSAALLPSALLLELAFIDRGPSLQELESYRQLPPQIRPIAARKLLARIDRAERKTFAVQLAIDLMTAGILSAGSAMMRDRHERVVMVGFLGATLCVDAITMLASLLKRTRLEQLSLGRRPSANESVFW